MCAEYLLIILNSCTIQESQVVVTGLKIISDSFSVQVPEYLPLMVLYDPPGGMQPKRIIRFLSMCFRCKPDGARQRSDQNEDACALKRGSCRN